ncbi:MAG: hypothetical protein ABT19_03920 [Rhodanobacter sp. SCN 68-63]|nr:MAG: hypothetical protein ABT19_03920 [Rhodanobacter sp. SCN 68-63]
MLTPKKMILEEHSDILGGHTVYVMPLKSLSNPFDPNFGNNFPIKFFYKFKQLIYKTLMDFLLLRPVIPPEAFLDINAFELNGHGIELMPDIDK